VHGNNIICRGQPVASRYYYHACSVVSRGLLCPDSYRILVVLLARVQSYDSFEQKSVPTDGDAEKQEVLVN
jgi:hypothetical protein